MLTQRLVADQNTNQGTLTITCPVGDLAELMGLQEELKLRANMTTQGSIITGETPPVVVGGGDGI